MPTGTYERKSYSWCIEDYLGAYDIILATRIKETIDMFDEGLARWFGTKDQRATHKQRNSYYTIRRALKKAKSHRDIFIQMHVDVPTILLAELLGVTSAWVSKVKHSKKVESK